ncbi:hypothetical protein EB796_014094 [Bugula neritina]|uniref:UTP14A n=1 Tax=Bugula neritina TaxID=10212 RepID=A0A7J7JNV8_BUGNE|nr:hypothetical protein EB796_014094 [Bugula neritina]
MTNKVKGILKKREAVNEHVVDNEAVLDGHMEKEDNLSEVKHASLLKAIQSLDGKKAPILQRGETALSSSEDHTREMKSVHFGDLLKSLNSSNTVDVKKHIQKQDGSGKVPEPLEKVHVVKAERTVTYQEKQSEVGKWQSIIESNRVAPQQRFPLERPKLMLMSARKDAASHQPRTALELEMQALLKGPGFVAEEEKPVLTKAEQRVMKAMDVARAKEELALRRKHRRMVADVASKNRRQGKIKSRRKRDFKALEKLKTDDPALWKEKAEEIERARIEERATLRHKGKSKFAKLAKRYGKYNEKIKDSLDEMRSRGVELLTKQAAEEESESELDEELRGDVNMSESDEDGEEEEVQQTLTFSSNNPWMSGKLSKESSHKSQFPVNTGAFDAASSSDEDDNPVEGVTNDPTSLGRELEPQSNTDMDGDTADVVNEISDNTDTQATSPKVLKNKEKKTASKKKTRKEVSKTVNAPSAVRQAANEVNISQSKAEAIAAAQELEDDADALMDGVSTDRMKSREDVDRFDNIFHQMSAEEISTNQTEEGNSSDEETSAETIQNIDPKKVISIPSTDLSGQVQPMGESDSEDDEQRLNIAEAFADDDVMEEFSTRRKRKLVEEEEASDAATALNVLPGWGKWGGAGIVAKGKKPRSKMTRFEKEKRRIENLKKAAAEKVKEEERERKLSKFPSNVIINEKALKNQPIVKYQVDPKKLGMKSSAFSAMMSQPVGKDFIPTIAHNELCKPRVVTSAGAIIAPMSKSMLTKSKKEEFPESTRKAEAKVAQQYQLKRMKPRKNPVKTMVKRYEGGRRL